jgi:ABC-type glycerol-3-phosphate transport system permease component
MSGLRDLRRVTGIHLVLLLVALANVFPLYYMLSASFKDQFELIKNQIGLPASIGFGNYVELLVERGFPRLFLNSSILTVSSITVALVISCLAAYALAHMDFWGRRPLLDFITALMAIPPIVVVVPLFVFMNRLHLINQYPSAAIVYIGFLLPFSIFIMTGFFISIPRELIEAAKIDGAGDLRILVQILMPLAKAPLTTLVIVNGLWVWNDLLIAIMFLQKQEMRTLMAGIAFLHGRSTWNIPLAMSGAVLASIPMLVALVVGQRAFVRGLMGGTTK